MKKIKVGDKIQKYIVTEELKERNQKGTKRYKFQCTLCNTAIETSPYTIVQRINNCCIKGDKDKVGETKIKSFKLPVKITNKNIKNLALYLQDKLPKLKIRACNIKLADADLPPRLVDLNGYCKVGRTEVKEHFLKVNDRTIEGGNIVYIEKGELKSRKD
jgi:hypothetical protein